MEVATGTRTTNTAGVTKTRVSVPAVGTIVNISIMPVTAIGQGVIAVTDIGTVIVSTAVTGMATADTNTGTGTVIADTATITVVGMVIVSNAVTTLHSATQATLATRGGAMEEWLSGSPSDVVAITNNWAVTGSPPQD